MTEIQRLRRHAVVYGLANALNAALGLILLPLYTRYLAPADYGVWEVFAVTIAFSLVILQAGLARAVTQTILHERPGDEEKLYATAFLTTATLAVVFALAVWCLAADISELLFSDTGQAGRIRLIGIGIALGALPAIPLQRLRIREESKRFARIGVTRFLAGAGLNILFVAGLGWGVDGLVAAFVGQTALVALWVVPPFLRATGIACDRPGLRTMLAFGIPVIPIGIAMGVMDLSDRYFLRAYRDLGEVGVYGIAYKIGLAMTLLVQAVQVAWPPVMYSLVRREDGRETLARLMTYWVALLACGGLALSLLAREALLVLATPAYLSGHRIVVLVCLSYLLLGVRNFAVVGANINRKTGLMALAAVLACLVNLALNRLLIPTHGAMGAAIATAVSYACLALLAGTISQRYYRVPYQWRRLAVVAVLAAGLYGIGQTVPADPLWVSVAIKASLIAALPVLLLVTGFFTKTERRDIRALIRGLRSESVRNESEGPDGTC